MQKIFPFSIFLSLLYLGLTFQSHASVITSSEWQYTPSISGTNGDALLSPRQVVDSRLDANTSESRFTGVVSLQIKKNSSTFICSGTVISDQHILSAAHCVDSDGNGTVVDLTQANTSIKAIFNHNGDASAIINADKVQIHADYQGFNICPNGSVGCLNDDIAVISLAEKIPEGVEIYDFYTQTVQATQLFTKNGNTFTLVGYGKRGDGYNGFFDNPIGSPSWTEKLVGGNIVDILRADDEDNSWNEVWYADFDGHNQVHGKNIDTLCRYYGLCSSWLDESTETIIGGGDSGGPSFIYNSISDEYLLAGISTFGSYNYATNEGGFGDLFGGILLNPYIHWINDIVGVSSLAINAPNSLWFFILLIAFFSLNKHTTIRAFFHA